MREEEEMKKAIVVLSKGVKESAGPLGPCCYGSFVPFRGG